MSLSTSAFKGFNESDQRYFPRWEIDKRVVYQAKNIPDEKQSRAIDMSCAGVCILCEEQLLPTQEIRLDIFLSEATIIRMTGHVVWVKNFANQNQAGIIFNEIDQASQDTILEHAFNVNKKDLVRYWFKGWEGNNAPDGT